MTKIDPKSPYADPEADASAGDPAARIGAFVSDHPFAAAGAAIAAGAVIGLLLPRWKVGAAAGSSLMSTATKAAKALAAAETARTVFAGFSAATTSVKAGAHRIAEHVPATGDVKAGAKRALEVLEHAGETAQKAGKEVARTVRRKVKAGTD